MTLTLLLKTCPVCRETKTAAEFYRSGRTGDRLSYECKSCATSRAKKNREQRRSAMGDAAFREHTRQAVAKSRQRTGNRSGIEYNKARSRAIAALIEAHRDEFDRLLLLARRDELN